MPHTAGIFAAMNCLRNVSRKAGRSADRRWTCKPARDLGDLRSGSIRLTRRENACQSLNPANLTKSARKDGLARRASEGCWGKALHPSLARRRSEEHTSELQSRGHLVCRLLLEKKKNNINRERHL